MAPNVKEKNENIQEYYREPGLAKLVAPQADSHTFELIYHMIFQLIFIHILGLMGITYIFTAKWATLVFMYIYCVFGFMGITMGVHRLWSHRSFKATMPLQVILVLCHSSLHQFSVMWWCENHRQHHKYSDTDADPHNATRGFFFSHIGWLMVTPHPEAQRRSQHVNNRDLKNDPLLAFQRKYIAPIMITMSHLVPTFIPLLWGEDIFASYHLNALRLIITYNALFCVNSVAHKWGNRPYDEHIKPTQNNWVSFIMFGEGSHNFHHAFPWDYRSDEWGGRLNVTTILIDALARIGWVYDLKTVPQGVVDAKAMSRGDGTKNEKHA